VGSNRLLIVDDEVGITSVIEHIARSMEFEVLAIHDPTQFEKALARIRPSIIFLDISMPGRDGMQLITQLGTASYEGHVVIMSGSDPRYIQTSLASAAARGIAIAGTLPKPFRKQQVVDLLSRFSDRPAT
jgi:DNA-binding NtrC family response regulator